MRRSSLPASAVSVGVTLKVLSDFSEIGWLSATPCPRLPSATPVPPELQAESDPALLNAILTNLFSNACEYTPANGRILIHVGALPNQSFCIRVCNTVQDLEVADLPQLFEPFWRKQGSRNDSEHFGLGLALARNLAELIGMRLDASMANAQEIVFELRPQQIPAVNG